MTSPRQPSTCLGRSEAILPSKEMSIYFVQLPSSPLCGSVNDAKDTENKVIYCLHLSHKLSQAVDLANIITNYTQLKNCSVAIQEVKHSFVHHMYSVVSQACVLPADLLNATVEAGITACKTVMESFIAGAKV